MSRDRVARAAIACVLVVLAAVVLGALALGPWSDDDPAPAPVGTSSLTPDEPSATTDAAEPIRHFTVDGAEILDPDGEPFVPVGMNLLGPNAFFNPEGVTLGLASVLDEAWQVNAVRLNSCLPGEGCPYTGISNDRNGDLDAIVRELVDREIVVIIALHEIQPGRFPNEEQIAAMGAWWGDIAARYADEPYVWFNLQNEPGNDRPASPYWLEVQRALLGHVRAAGAENPVVIDGTHWGQEAGSAGVELVRAQDSALLSFGPDLLAEDPNVIFSFHAYDQWGQPDATDQERDRRLADFLDRIHDAGMAVLIGEVGGATDPCCEPEALAAQTVYRVAPGRGVGLLAWHGQAVDGHRLVLAEGATSPDDIDDWESPGNLTWQGRLLWDLTHG